MQAARYRLSRDNTLEVIAAEVRRACAGHVRNGVREPCGFSPQQLSKHENGMKASREHIEALCAVYQRSAEDLGLIVWERKSTARAGEDATPTEERSSASPAVDRQAGSTDALAAAAARVLDDWGSEEAEPMDRRAFSKGVGIAMGAAAADPVVALARHGREQLHRSRVGDGWLADMERTARRYARTYPTTHSDSAYAHRYVHDLCADWAAVGTLLNEEMAPRQVIRACHVYAELSGILGLLAVAFAKPRTARELFQAGRDAAREAGDHDLLGWMYAAECYLPLEHGDPVEVLHLTDAGLAAIGTGRTRSRAWLHGLAARAHAELAGAEPFRRALVDTALEAAHDAMSGASGGAWDGGEGLAIQFAFDTNQLLSYTGRAYVASGDVERGMVFCERAKATYDGTPLKQYTSATLTHVSLATAILLPGDPREAAELATRSLTAYAGHSRSVLRRMAAFEVSLAPHRELPAVRDFSDLLRERRRGMLALPSA